MYVPSSRGLPHTNVRVYVHCLVMEAMSVLACTNLEDMLMCFPHSGLGL